LSRRNVLGIACVPHLTHNAAD
ncbi:hypothetical protein MGSAQ_000934, partial [marine sediment metagenome]